MHKAKGYEIKVHHEGQVHALVADGSGSLLQLLTGAGFEIYAPCGGNGTCGKCKVWIKGEGSVSSCLFPVGRDMTVILPDRKEAQILVAQHQHLVELAFQPGPSAGLSSNPFGVAIDIGTTSLVFYLMDMLTGSVVETRALGNPQTSCGADVISRITYATQNTGGLAELQKAIVRAINMQFRHFCRLLRIRHNDIVKISIAGNTTMLHLLLGVDPLSIALAPFTPKFTDSQTIKADDIGLECHQAASIKTLPCISAYVGADIVAGLASIDHSGKETFLFMDIGTNGELALVTRGKVFCCATAAGPAFEGARIEHGMTAEEGAISAFGPQGFSVIGDVPPTGICGSGLIDIVAFLLEKGIVDQDGVMDEDFFVAEKNNSRTIVLTQQDIREVQLAKSAIAAGVNILMKKAGVDHEVIDRVYLAGGFGNYFNIKNAMRIGLLSPLFNGRVVPLGNTSGTGAILDLKSTDFMRVINGLLSATEYIELSNDDDFTVEFAMNMMF
jgi:uncharacterized 2Fe-2S/4Fe-4S cluster protein (DUF4445 family)